MEQKAFQDYFPDHFSHCYGCGRLNEYGFHIRSYWDGDEGLCRFQPESYHIAVPGYVYGGLIASIIDCHCACTASAAAYRAEGREIGTEPLYLFLTASLHVDFLRPTPLDGLLEVRASIKERTERKAVVTAVMTADGNVCVKGEVVVVRVPERLMP